MNLNGNDIRLGENLQTQFSRNNTDDAHYYEVSKTANTTYNNYSPMHQRSEEEYQVEYDPEILADLQKLKGGNWFCLKCDMLYSSIKTMWKILS